MNFIIHIGTHKTGSTALQAFLFANRKLLIKNGFLYPTTGLKGNAHHEIAWTIKSEDTKQIKEIFYKIEKEAIAANISTVILSSEEFEFIRNKNILKPLFSINPKVIIFIRRQDTYFESEYNQHIKMYSQRYSHDIYHFYFHRDLVQRFNYRHLCDIWEYNPNAKSVQVINYDQCLADSCGIFKKFLSQIGIKWSEDFIVPESRESNVSIPNAATIYLARINRLDLSSSLHQSAIQSVIKEFKDLPKRQLLSYEDRLILWNRFLGTNNFVVNNYDVEPFVKPNENDTPPESIVHFYYDFEEEIFNKMIQEIRLESNESGLEKKVVNIMQKKELNKNNTNLNFIIGKYVIGFPNSRRIKLFFERNKIIGNVELVEAVNGKSLPVSLVRHLFKPSFYNHQLEKKSLSWIHGTLGCLLSQIKAVEKAQQDNVEYALICEDDAYFRQSPDDLFNLAKQYSYDIVFIYDGMNPGGQRQFTGEYSIKTLTAANLQGTGAVAYILSQQAMKVIQELFTSNLKTGLLKSGLPAGYDSLIQSTVLKKGETVDRPGKKGLGVWHNSHGTNLHVGVSVPTIVTHDDEGVSLIRD